MENQADQQGVVGIYTTDRYQPFVKFKSTRDDFERSTEMVRRKNVLLPVIGDTTVHIFPDHITAITFTPTKEN